MFLANMNVPTRFKCSLERLRALKSILRCVIKLSLPLLQRLANAVLTSATVCFA